MSRYIKRYMIFLFGITRGCCTASFFSVSPNIIKTLQEREWIRVVGHRDVPGKPAMYATTREFLDYFNLKTLDQLPPLSELKDLDKLNAELDLRLPGEEFAGGEEAATSPAVIAPDMEPVFTTNAYARNRKVT